ncbi:hypothetical protein T06_10195 [Trichinella sp. T6]|nr:hypothetical protein T06_10195 [Trichinella sp. T6]
MFMAVASLSNRLYLRQFSYFSLISIASLTSF